MKFNYKLLVLCIAIPLAIGSLSGFLTSESMEMFSSINKPPLSPPAILFPIVWTILYILMGIASYLMFTSGQEKNRIKNPARFTRRIAEVSDSFLLRNSYSFRKRHRSLHGKYVFFLEHFWKQHP